VSRSAIITKSSGLSHGAPQELKSAFRSSPLQYHPDKNPGDKLSEDKFKECSEAYEVLADTEKRARYDRFGHQAPGGFGPKPIRGRVSGTSTTSSRHLRRDLRPARPASAGAPARSRPPLQPGVSFTEAAFATEAKVKIPGTRVCAACHGSGPNGHQPEDCPTVQRRGRSSG